jgi:hypothetical protein
MSIPYPYIVRAVMDIRVLPSMYVLPPRSLPGDEEGGHFPESTVNDCSDLLIHGGNKLLALLFAWEIRL